MIIRICTQILMFVLNINSLTPSPFFVPYGINKGCTYICSLTYCLIMLEYLVRWHCLKGGRSPTGRQCHRTATLTGGNVVLYSFIFFTMLNNSSHQKWARLEKKGLDNQFMNEIITGMNCSPFEAKAALDTVHKVYGDFFETAGTLAPGKAKFIVVSAEDSLAKSLEEAKKISVC